MPPTGSGKQHIPKMYLMILTPCYSLGISLLGRVFKIRIPSSNTNILLFSLNLLFNKVTWIIYLVFHSSLAKMSPSHTMFHMHNSSKEELRSNNIVQRISVRSGHLTICNFCPLTNLQRIWKFVFAQIFKGLAPC